MNFLERLRAIQRRSDSLVCIGLDTDLNRIPASLQSARDPVVEFNTRIIDATKDLVCAYKINLAFAEAAGERAWSIVHQTLSRIPEGIITIGDAKRGDIGSSAAMYARSLFDEFRFTACTVNPYMGSDSVEPFIRDAERGAFILALTSNAGAKDFQYLRIRAKPLYEHVVAKAKRWNTKQNCGVVVGATRPAELRRIRALAPDMPILIPGVGAQGGDLKSAVRYGCDRNGDLAVINASRSVLYASAGDDFAPAARTAALTMRDEINRYREKYF